MRNEAEVLNAILAGIGGPGEPYKLWRQQAGEVAAMPLKFLQKARKLGLPAFKMTLAPEGAADIVGIGPGGRFIAIECKSPGGKPREAQLKWGAMIQSRGGVWIYATSLDEARDRLRLHD